MLEENEPKPGKRTRPRTTLGELFSETHKDTDTDTDDSSSSVKPSSSSSSNSSHSTEQQHTNHRHNYNHNHHHHQLNGILQRASSARKVLTFSQELVVNSRFGDGNKATQSGPLLQHLPKPVLKKSTAKTSASPFRFTQLTNQLKGIEQTAGDSQISSSPLDKISEFERNWESHYEYQFTSGDDSQSSDYDEISAAGTGEPGKSSLLSENKWATRSTRAGPPENVLANANRGTGLPENVNWDNRNREAGLPENVNRDNRNREAGLPENANWDNRNREAVLPENVNRDNRNREAGLPENVNWDNRNTGAGLPENVNWDNRNMGLPENVWVNGSRDSGLPENDWAKGNRDSELPENVWVNGNRALGLPENDWAKGSSALGLPENDRAKGSRGSGLPENVRVNGNPGKDIHGRETQQRPYVEYDAGTQQTKARRKTAGTGAMKMIKRIGRQFGDRGTEDSRMKHGVTMRTVEIPEGMLGLGWQEGIPLMLASGSYRFPVQLLPDDASSGRGRSHCTFALHDVVSEKSTFTCHGDLHRIFIREGHLGVVWIRGKAQFLESGVSLFTCPPQSFSFISTHESPHLLQQKEFVLGPFRVITVADSEIGIKFCNREPHILEAGRHCLSISRLEIFAGFESLLKRHSNVNGAISTTKDNIPVSADISLEWQIKAEDAAAARGANITDVEGAVLEKVRRAFGLVMWEVDSKDMLEQHQAGSNQDIGLMEVKNSIILKDPHPIMGTLSSDISRELVELFEEGWSVTLWQLHVTKFVILQKAQN